MMRPLTVSVFAKAGVPSATTKAAIVNPANILRIESPLVAPENSLAYTPAARILSIPLRQVVIPRYGAPEVLAPREAPDPVPRAGEVRIGVSAAGVNFADVLARLGLYPDAPKPPMVVGYEASGVVDAVGPGVTAHREGDRVVALTRFNGYADRVVVPEGF